MPAKRIRSGRDEVHATRTRFSVAARLSLLVVVAILAAQVPGQTAAPTTDSLKFFKNYFITGGYKVAGVGLAGQAVNGIATGNINMTGVPAGAEVLAAFLYAQVISSSGPDAAGAGATFNGVPLSIPSGTFAAVDPNGATPCWSDASAGKRTYSLRYDVLRMLPRGADGRAKANGTHVVQLPGLANLASDALGASLVVFYRDPNPAAKLTAFVIYDGSWAMDSSTHGMFQTIRGFYDPAAVPGVMTHIVGSGSSKSEKLKVNGVLTGPNGGINEFRSTAGTAWDNVTVTVPNLNGADSFTTVVDDTGIDPADCLTWSAIIYATEVNDDDGDGYLNRWESAPWSGTLVDPDGVPLPDLVAMGTPGNPVGPLHKDLFVEIGFMRTYPATSNAGAAGVNYGGELKPHHTHRPSAATLTKVYQAFKNAPVTNPDLTPGINVHIDIGNEYPGVQGLIPSPLARGGESLDEMSTVCQADPGDPPGVCQFSGFPGTLGWKTGFRVVRDALKSIPVDPTLCDAPGNDGPGQPCERVFDRNRFHIFRYFFFPHLLGVPKAHCLDLTGTPQSNNHYGLPVVETCQKTNPDFHVPNTYTGIADFGGGDGAVSMGGFPNAAGEPIGTDDQVASTFMHEIGHTLMLAHGGFKGNSNCNPNYLSIMNYTFQLRLLANGAGGKDISYSTQALAPLDEFALAETNGLGAVPYKTAWYTPFGGVGTAATRHCDGSQITNGAQMIRVDGTSVAGGIDWDGDGSVENGTVAGDINFNGVDETGAAPLSGFNDWSHIRLNQVSARRNIGVFFFTDEDPLTPGVEVHIGPASLGMEKTDFGDWDFGDWDFGDWDFGDWDFGDWDFGDPSALNYGDLNLGDIGRNSGDWDFGDWDFGDWDFGDWDFGDWDFGDWDFGDWDFGAGAGDAGRGIDGKGDFGRPVNGGPVSEITREVAVAAGLFTGPTNMTVCAPLGLGLPSCDVIPGTGLRVQLRWAAADAPPTAYVVYRRPSTATQFTVVGSPLAPTTLSFVDNTVAYNTTYFYYVAAQYVESGQVNERPSNISSVKTNPQLYTLLPVSNIPPTTSPSTGSTVSIAWQYQVNGVVINSSDARPRVKLRSISKGVMVDLNLDDVSIIGYLQPTAANDRTWSFNVKFVYPIWYPQAGQNLPPSNDYEIIIESKKAVTYTSSKFTVQ